MKAMILAAGLGSRLWPITQSIPKPLLEVKGQCLIDRHLIQLKQAGINEVIINVSHLADNIINHLGSGERFGIKIRYSKETEPLETGGGIKNALTLLGQEPFILLSSDIYTDFDFKNLPLKLNDRLAHLVMIKNPWHHPIGDFCLQNNVICFANDDKVTYANIALIDPKLFNDTDGKQKFPLIDVLTPAINNKRVSGQLFAGLWHNIGSHQELELIQQKNR